MCCLWLSTSSPFAPLVLRCLMGSSLTTTPGGPAEISRVARQSLTETSDTCQGTCETCSLVLLLTSPRQASNNSMCVCRHPDVIIDVGYDATNMWTHGLHTGRQVMALMVQQLLVKEYQRKRPDVPSWFSLKCASCCRKRKSVSLCLD